MNQTIRGLLRLIIFIISIYLVVHGQKNIGFQGLATMLVGLAGILGLLFVYNKAHQ
ncbi:MAG: hypothetical protein GX366_05835 [Epulopiscium sp.]|nr:hypothetical protein [Candidatus Epulonipiscium sp.]